MTALRNQRAGLAYRLTVGPPILRIAAFYDRLGRQTLSCIPRLGIIEVGHA